ncbi:MAG: class I SAM-dependent methyltransferase [Deltaproteobacteria bacterium]|nr:class I SAM-dependent methyltransferase [Deltaproteobacteria bacterium]
MFEKIKSYMLFKTLSHLTDQQWLEILIKSIERPYVGLIKLPGFPPEQLQHRINGSSGEDALKAAFNIYSWIKLYTKSLGINLGRNSCVLDFGCGWGRIIRFFLKDVLADNLYGVDVNPEMITICQERVRHGNYSVVSPLPPIDFSADSIDIIYAYSVFSHLAEPVHIKWIEEFSRVLKPKGIFFATTWSRDFIEFCRSLRGKTHESPWYNSLANSFLESEAALKDYDSGKFVYSPTGGGPALPSSFYGEAVIPRKYIELEWTKYLAFVNFVDNRNIDPQVIVIMQKK